MERQLDHMPPSTPSDPRATTVHVTGDMSALPGIPGYKVLKKLGQGGMATVYMATQISLDRTVSIKVMEREALSDEVSMQRFENEDADDRPAHPSEPSSHIYEVGRTDRWADVLHHALPRRTAISRSATFAARMRR